MKPEKMLLYSLFILFISISCGIKRSPVPLEYPKFSTKVIGNVMYIIPEGGINKPEGFKYMGNFIYKSVSKGECIVITAPHRKKKKVCIENTITKKPKVKLEEHEDYILLRVSGFERYVLYPYGEFPLFKQGREFGTSEIRLNKDYEKKCYALTGVIGNYESPFYRFCVTPKPLPTPPPPESLSLFVFKDRLLLVWSFKEGFEYILYRNGKEIKRLKGNIFIDKLPKGETLYEVVAISPLGAKSKPAKVLYRP